MQAYIARESTLKNNAKCILSNLLKVDMLDLMGSGGVMELSADDIIINTVERLQWIWL